MSIYSLPSSVETILYPCASTNRVIFSTAGLESHCTIYQFSPDANAFCTIITGSGQESPLTSIIITSPYFYLRIFLIAITKAITKPTPTAICPATGTPVPVAAKPKLCANAAPAAKPTTVIVESELPSPDKIS